LFGRDGSSDGRNARSVSPRQGFKAAKRALKGELSYQKWREAGTPAFPSQRKRFLEVIRCWFEGVVLGKFIDRSTSSRDAHITCCVVSLSNHSVSGIDELRNRGAWKSGMPFGRAQAEALSLHDVFDGVRVLNECDDAPAYAKATARSTTSVVCTWGTLGGQFHKCALCTRPIHSYGTLSCNHFRAPQLGEGRAWRVRLCVCRSSVRSIW
jgi:hypothetical protein